MRWWKCSSCILDFHRYFRFVDCDFKENPIWTVICEGCFFFTFCKSQCKSRYCTLQHPLFFLLSLCACILISQVTTRGEAHLELNAFRRKHDCALVISGDSLEVSQRVSHNHPATDLLRPVFCLLHRNRNWKWCLWLESHDSKALVVPIYSWD